MHCHNVLYRRVGERAGIFPFFTLPLLTGCRCHARVALHVSWWLQVQLCVRGVGKYCTVAGKGELRSLLPRSAGSYPSTMTYSKPGHVLNTDGHLGDGILPLGGRLLGSRYRYGCKWLRLASSFPIRGPAYLRLHVGGRVAELVPVPYIHPCADGILYLPT